MFDKDFKKISKEEIAKALDWPEIKPDNEWRLEDGKYIVHRVNGYEIELERCKTSAQVLDWIFHIYPKTWVTPKTMYDLLTHLQKHVDPQATLCSWGEEGSERKGK